MEKHIIAIGGGGFGRENSDLTIEKYILSRCKKPNPKICFLPQASCESQDYIVKFFETFSKLDAKPSWLSLFGRVPVSWKSKLLGQDIIYVGGGNTKSMIALWKAWELDHVLKEVYQRGTILCGVSAGAICWFEQGITDSVWPLGVVEGLGILNGSFCPHFDSEPERPEAYRTKVISGEIKPGIALEDNTAAHFVDGRLQKIVKWNESARGFKVKQHGLQEEIETVLLNR